jgi:glucose-6-phosphate 1-dehydrogenase
VAARESTAAANRLFYLAVPPAAFVACAATVSAVGQSATGWNRLVVEKPFGHDSASSEALGRALAAHFPETSIYRIDHYLGKEMVQNLMVLRFANAVFEPLWNREHISTVQVTFKEPIGTDGRGGYFDDVGIIRDVMQNHLLQVLSLVAMEPPVSMSAEDIRDEKVKVLRCVSPLDVAHTVVGQYGPNAAGTQRGYTEDPTVPQGSKCPTFAAAVLHINNARWAGVPFILKAGKALNERKAEVRIQFRPPASGLFGAMGGGGGIRGGGGGGDGGDPAAVAAVGVGQGKPLSVHQNELVIRIQPKEAVYLKLISRLPGMEFEPVETELSLSYSQRFAGHGSAPGDYARLILDVLRGDQSQFVRADELTAAWRIFTPYLHAAAAGPHPIIYPFGSRGPPQADDLIRACGYSWEGHYAGSWLKDHDPASGPAALEAARSEFTLSTQRLRSLVENFLGEMTAGLAGAPSSLKMIPSFVTALPTGSEGGSAWAIDLGGSNLRVLHVGLTPGAPPRVLTEHKVTVPPAVQAGPGEALFDLIARACVEAGLPATEGGGGGSGGGGAKLGFTFSFPYAQHSLGSGTLLEWTKGFSAPGVVGKDVSLLLEAAFARAGRAGQRVTALANDTVGTLCAGAAVAPATRIGLILGTGTNAAYMERLSRVEKWSGGGDAGSGMAINMEWGAFGSGNDVHAFALLPFHSVDHELDVATPNPSKQRFEKMISGMYLGELARRLLVQLVAKGAIFVTQRAAAGAAAAAAAAAAAGGGAAATAAAAGGSAVAAAAAAAPGAAAAAIPSGLNTPWAFTTGDMAELSEDASEDLRGVAGVVERALGIPGCSLDCRRKVVEVCRLVAKRAARLAAGGVAAVATQILSRAQAAGAEAPPRIGCAVDGSVFKRYPGFAQWMREALQDLGVDCDLTHAEDGSGIVRGVCVCVCVRACVRVRARR